MIIKVLACDWNGTLQDDVHVLYAGARAVFEHFRLPTPPLEDYREGIMHDPMVYYQSRGILKSVPREDIWQIFTPVVEAHLHEARLRPETHEIIAFCKTRNVRLAIVSGDNQNRIERQLVKFEIRDEFHPVMGGVRNKTQAIESVAHQLGVQATEIMMIDDAAIALVQARLAGAITVGFTDGYQKPETVKGGLPFYCADSLRELIPILRRHTPLF